ncbi:MAG: hypothetical protein IPN60_17525 [Saprospiraceae bacterium]|nr:hypothetical protein [Candidatus Opimibacter skivensis]
MFSTDVLSYHFALKPAINLPKDIEWLMPYDDPETRRCMSTFYQQFYNDTQNAHLSWASIREDLVLA